MDGAAAEEGFGGFAGELADGLVFLSAGGGFDEGAVEVGERILDAALAVAVGGEPGVFKPPGDGLEFPGAGPVFEEELVEFVAGPKYPKRIRWPANVERTEHLAPRQHRAFYNAQRYTLNVTRADMIRLGWSPSVRLFEAAACGTAIVSDWWDGLDSLLQPDEEILIARGHDDMLRILRKIPEHERRRIGLAAQARVLAAHTAAHRAAELEAFALTELRHRLAA